MAALFSNKQLLARVEIIRKRFNTIFLRYVKALESYLSLSFLGYQFNCLSSSWLSFPTLAWFKMPAIIISLWARISAVIGCPWQIHLLIHSFIAIVARIFG